MINKLKKAGVKNVIIRFIIFIVFAYFVIPSVIKNIAAYFSLKSVLVFELNYLSFSLFPLFVIGTFILLKRNELLDLKKYKFKWLECGTFSLIAYIFLFNYFIINYLLSLQIVSRNILFLALLSYFLYGAGMFFIGLAIFNYYFFKRFFRSIIASISVSACFFQVTIILIFMQNLNLLSNIIAKITHLFLSIFFSNTFIKLGSNPLLSLNNFSVRITSLCSSFESLIMFTSLFFLILLYDWKKINKKSILYLFPAGLAGMFFVSILRIYLIMITGAFISPTFATGPFHVHVGWILFVGYFFVFYFIFYNKYLIKTTTKPF